MVFCIRRTLSLCVRAQPSFHNQPLFSSTSESILSIKPSQSTHIHVHICSFESVPDVVKTYLLDVKQPEADVLSYLLLLRRVNIDVCLHLLGRESNSMLEHNRNLLASNIHMQPLTPFSLVSLSTAIRTRCCHIFPAESHQNDGNNKESNNPSCDR
jgi:hypothetical protein